LTSPITPRSTGRLQELVLEVDAYSSDEEGEMESGMRTPSRSGSGSGSNSEEKMENSVHSYGLSPSAALRGRRASSHRQRSSTAIAAGNSNANASRERNLASSRGRRRKLMVAGVMIDASKRARSDSAMGLGGRIKARDASPYLTPSPSSSDVEEDREASSDEMMEVVELERVEGAVGTMG